ncbi:hypothetical protein [Pseudomonas lactis]
MGDRNLNVLDMLYDEQGRLHFLVDKYSQTVVQLHYDQHHPNRVGKASRVFLKAGENPSIERNKTLASYRYTRSGQLHEVLDATDHVVRRFTYTAEGYLNSHQIASGAVREYEWARFAIPENRPTPKRADGTAYQLPPLLEPQPDHEWRVTRHWGTTDAPDKTKHLSWNVHGQLLAIVPMRKRCTTTIPTGACAKTSMPMASTLTIGMTHATT